MTRIAAAAGVGRSTLYRHFPTRKRLIEALEARAAERSSSEPSAGRADPAWVAYGGRPSAPTPSTPPTCSTTCPPTFSATQLVAEAQRIAGVPVALYLVDIDGSHLLRLAGSEEFPALLGDELARASRSARRSRRRGSPTFGRCSPRTSPAACSSPCGCGAG